MTSIERTAYPRFERLLTAHDMEGFTPSSDEVAWARGRTRSEPHFLDLLVALKCCQHLGRFPGRGRPSKWTKPAVNASPNHGLGEAQDRWASSNVALAPS